MDLDDKNKELLDLIQSNFPIAERPYKEIGKNLGLSEEEVIKRLRSLKEDKYIKFIGAIINTASLGYKSLLATFRVDPEKIEKAVEIINSHPGVSHNYQRNDPYNIWFTITTPKDIDINKTVETIFNNSGAEKYLLLPTLKVYKIGLILDVSDKNNTSDNKTFTHTQDTSYEISPEEKRVLMQIQNSLPVVEEPFNELASKADMSVSEFLKIINDMLQKGIIRRLGSILAHRKIGYNYNVLGLWEIPEDKIDDLGEKLASIKNITHCYKRPVYPDWPYSLYSMIHCRSEAECSDLIKNILKENDIKDHKLLLSVKEHKKIRLKYFTDEFYKWQKENK